MSELIKPWMTDNEKAFIKDKGRLWTSGNAEWKIVDWSIPKYKLDYSKVIDRTQKDMNVYNRKFWLYHEAARLGKLGQNECIRLLNDPTIYMYAMFDIKHRWYQDLLASDDYRYRMFIGANQVVGKSFMLNTTAVNSFLLDHGYQFIRGIVSATLDPVSYTHLTLPTILLV